MHDYIYSQYAASRLGELRAEAARERLARQLPRPIRWPWPKLVVTIPAPRLAARRDAVACCA